MLFRSAIRENGAASVFWAGIIEQIISPIPSVFIPMSAGFLLIEPKTAGLSLFGLVIRKISLPYSLGATLGSSVMYWLAFLGGRALIGRFGKFFGLSLRHIDKFRVKFTRGFRDELIIFLLLVLPATPISIVAVSCGLIGIKAWGFYPLMIVGTFARSALLAILGWKMGEAYFQLSSKLDLAESLLSIGIIGTAFLVLVFLYYKRSKFFNQ